MAVFLALVARANTVTAQYSRSPLELWIDRDGTAYLHNTTSEAILFDGYQITSGNGQLDPAAWNSITDQVASSPFTVISALGAGAVSFGEANPNPANLAELNLGGFATLAPDAKFSIGKPFRDLVNLDAFADFFYKIAGSPVATEGSIGPRTPEPATWLLSVAAAAVCLVYHFRCGRRN